MILLRLFSPYYYYDSTNANPVFVILIMLSVIIFSILIHKFFLWLLPSIKFPKEDLKNGEQSLYQFPDILMQEKTSRLNDENNTPKLFPKPEISSIFIKFLVILIAVFIFFTPFRRFLGDWL
ncbi:hypothetical protein [Aquimarina algiphila]|uniref:Uncharacterized protein n=1 Tax=Aquimarina algiphila TaxID=2047982 RepID=A0A554VM98_9FLAO|nr:hypothetical protein [Aquimarina algiphila]TSE09352.1 hypothetical protein FOF46_08850 [Aquimarina algiphila]